ncbi:MAG: hypothetical protein EZS28_018878 [Streblomastix strix]|uniref:Uncharacterized protein n=1 Tax=Streblomastix strix TaxID=222440 RepID=A0A5J4VTV1_9EUKA|nr:MAG: hypothetical protein EZS28_018878 [Streblomastix strix]
MFNFELSIQFLKVYQAVAKDQQHIQILIDSAAIETLLELWIKLEDQLQTGHFPLLRDILNTCQSFLDCPMMRERMTVFVPKLVKLTLADQKPIDIRIQASLIVINALTQSASLSQVHVSNEGIGLIKLAFSKVHMLGDYRLQQNIIKIGYLATLTSQEQTNELGSELKFLLTDIIGDNAVLDLFSGIQSNSLSDNVQEICKQINKKAEFSETINVFNISAQVTFPIKSFASCEISFGKLSVTFQHEDYNFAIERNNIQRIAFTENLNQIRIILRSTPNEIRDLFEGI